MGPLDQVCVVFTGDNRLAQDFTSDRQALLDVVERFHGTAVPPYLRDVVPAEVVGKAAQSLIDVSHRRKAMIYIGNGFRLSRTRTRCSRTIGRGAPAAWAALRASRWNRR